MYTNKDEFGTPFERHYRAAASDGVAAHFTAAYDDGRLTLVAEADVAPVAGGGVAVFWRDVTARVRAEAALRESEARFRNMADAAPVIVERLPEQVAGCVLRHLPVNQLRPDALEDARAWNLGRSRAEDALDRIAVPPLPDGRGDECAGVWTAYDE